MKRRLPDDGLVLLEAVVVAEDGPRAELAPSPISPSPRYARWFALAPASHHGLLGLDEVAEVRPLRRCRSRGAGARRGRSWRAALTREEVTMVYGRICAPASISESVMTEPTSMLAPLLTTVRPRKMTPASMTTSGSISTVSSIRASPRRVTPARPNLSARRRCIAASAAASCTRSLTPSKLAAAVGRPIAPPCSTCHLDDVGQVEFALQIVGLEANQRVAQERDPRRIASGVDFGHVALGIARQVAMLADAAPHAASRRARCGHTRWGRRRRR